MEARRLDRVQVDVAGEIVEISWDERDTLLGKLRSVAGSVAVGAKFEAVGASRPVELDGDERVHLRTVLELLGCAGRCHEGRIQRRDLGAAPRRTGRRRLLDRRHDPKRRDADQELLRRLHGDNNSWLFRPAAPLMRSYDSDTFCLTLPHGTTTMRWLLIAANRGAHKLSVTLGHASIYKEVNDAIVNDSRALYWEDQIVIT